MRDGRLLLSHTTLGATLVTHLCRAGALATASLLLTACAAVDADAGPADASELLARVQAGGPYPTTIAFVQDVESYGVDGSSTTSSMQEYARVPGQLRIDLGQPAPATLLFADDRIIRVDATGVVERPGPSVPMLLMIDVLAQEPAAWLERAEELDVDTERLSWQEFEGRMCVVLGALRGETERTQVWFDAVDWLPVRYLETTGQGERARLTDGRAMDYREVDGRVFHTRFTFHIGGRLVMDERYRDIALDGPLPDDVFDVEAARRRHAAGAP